MTLLIRIIKLLIKIIKIKKVIKRKLVSTKTILPNTHTHTHTHARTHARTHSRGHPHTRIHKVRTVKIAVTTLPSMSADAGINYV